MKIRCIGDYLPEGVYTIHSVFNRVINFRSNNALVFISNQMDFLAPNAIIVDNEDLTQIKSLSISNKGIEINQNFYEFSKLLVYNSLVNIKNIDSDFITNRIRFHLNKYQSILPEKSLAFIIFPDRIGYFNSSFDKAFLKNTQNVCSEIANGNIINALQKIKGTGYGLTPSGDDFICGFLYGLEILRKKSDHLSDFKNEIFKKCSSTNPIVNSYQTNAFEGRFTHNFKMYLTSLHNKKENKAELHFLKIVQLGSTSGTDLLCGLYFGLKTTFSATN